MRGECFLSGWRLYLQVGIHGRSYGPLSGRTWYVFIEFKKACGSAGGGRGESKNLFSFISCFDPNILILTAHIM